MTTKKEAAYLIGGVGLGVYGTITVPKMNITKYVKFLIEVFEAKKRLQKILIEEYYRIDEAIKAEESFLNAINPNFRGSSTTVSFEVRDNGENRIIHQRITLVKNNGRV